MSKGYWPGLIENGRFADERALPSFAQALLVAVFDRIEAVFELVIFFLALLALVLPLVLVQNIAFEPPLCRALLSRGVLSRIQLVIVAHDLSASNLCMKQSVHQSADGTQVIIQNSKSFAADLLESASSSTALVAS